MKIEKFKKLKSGMYELQLENYDKLFTYEEVILEYELLLKKEITNSLMNKIIEKNHYYDCYYKALNIIKRSSKTRYELYIKLKNDFTEEIVNKVLDSLEKQNYINDKVYARSYLNLEINTTYHGPYRVRRDMENKGIDDAIIDEIMISYTDEIQEEKLKKIINKKVNSNRNKSNSFLLRKLKNELKMDGFNSSIIDNVLSNVKMEDDSVIREKEYQKLKKKLEKKYNGSELEYKIKEKMIQKGFY